MLCCFLIALAAAPGGAWLLGPAQAGCSNSRVWLLPGALAFGLSLSAALSAWALLWLLLPGFQLFHPLCRALLGGAI
jgi:hypothetical protein